MFNFVFGFMKFCLGCGFTTLCLGCELLVVSSGMICGVVIGKE